MRISDTQITLGGGNTGHTTHPGHKELVVVKSEPIIGCIGKLDTLVSYMDICLAQMPPSVKGTERNNDLEAVHAALCSLFDILPSNALPRCDNPLDISDDCRPVYEQLVRMSLVNKRLRSVVSAHRAVSTERFRSVGALRLNHLRALIREFEHTVYTCLLSLSVLDFGAADSLLAADRNGYYIFLENHFGIAAVAEFLNIASDFVYLVAHEVEKE